MRQCRYCKFWADRVLPGNWGDCCHDTPVLRILQKNDGITHGWEFCSLFEENVDRPKYSNHNTAIRQVELLNNG